MLRIEIMLNLLNPIIQFFFVLKIVVQKKEMFSNMFIHSPAETSCMH